MKDEEDTLVECCANCIFYTAYHVHTYQGQLPCGRCSCGKGYIYDDSKVCENFHPD